MLHARVGAAGAADTEFADMRAAYDSLPRETKALDRGLAPHHHSIAPLAADPRVRVSRGASRDQLKGAVPPSRARTHPALACADRSIWRRHQTRIIDLAACQRGPLLLRDLTEHMQTQRERRHTRQSGAFARIS
jgi:alpha-ketoglutarate-dependent 2,4-dichlorophenoxyacetate dioxygenase